MADVLAIDLGKTSCRAAHWSGAGRRDAEGHGAPGLAAADGIALAEAAVLTVAHPLCGGAADLVACVGAAGALSAPRAGAALAERLLGALGCRRVLVTSDAVTAHAGALAGQPGILLVAGTGAVATALGGTGGFVRVDGCGPWLGDDGSAAALGLAGLRAVLRAADGRGPPTALRDRATRRYGDPAGLPALLGGDANPARQAAAFAPDVVQAASDGDTVAAALLDRAVQDLAATVRAAVARGGLPSPAPLALLGGLSRAWPDLPHRLRDVLADVRLQPARGTALDGARLLADGRGAVPADLLAVRCARLG